MTRILMVRHRHRPNAITSAATLSKALGQRGIEIVDDISAGGINMVLSIGGDGTFLSAASSARALGVPLLGVNAGHMGFLTELGERGTGDLARKIAEGDFTVEQRMTLDVTMERPDGSSADDWALNEAVIMHTDVAHPVHFCAGGRRPGSVHLRRRRHDSVDANRVDGILILGWRACCVAGHGSDRGRAARCPRFVYAPPRRRTIRLRGDRRSGRHVDLSGDVV